MMSQLLFVFVSSVRRYSVGTLSVVALVSYLHVSISFPLLPNVFITFPGICFSMISSNLFCRSVLSFSSDLVGRIHVVNLCREWVKTGLGSFGKTEGGGRGETDDHG